MANSTFIQLPMDVTNPVELRRFLDKLVQQVDVAFGNRGDGSFSTEDSLGDVLTLINQNTTRITTLENAVSIIDSDLTILENAVDIIDSDLAALEDTVQDLIDGEVIVTVISDTILSVGTKTVLCDCTSSHIDITLPNPSTVFTSPRSNTISISKIDTTSNTVTILPFSTESVVGESTADLLAESEVINLITNGTDWYLGA